jgi:hypothetical protein
MLKAPVNRALLNKNRGDVPVVNKGVEKKRCLKHNVINCKICKK